LLKDTEIYTHQTETQGHL